MNVSKFASEMGFVMIQQPGVFIRTAIIALGQYVVPKLTPSTADDDI
jgi:hypothetical protein